MLHWLAIIKNSAEEVTYVEYGIVDLKQFLDVAASFILTDDSGLLCDAYNTTELGDEDCTRLFLMDCARFPAWLAERQNSVKTISDF